MRNLIMMIAFLYLFMSCNSQNKQELEKENTLVLSKTKWECKIAEGCVNYYEFKSDSNYIFYNCEMEGDIYFGDYYFRGDTLILDRKGSVYDKDLPKESIHRVTRKLYKALIEDDKLKHLSTSDWISDKWVKSDFKFDDSYSYKKVD